MDFQILSAAGLVAVNTLIHGLFIAVAASVLRPILGRVEASVRFLRDLVVLVAGSLWLMLAHALEIAIWAASFANFGARASFAEAYYLASLCYTTLGLDGLSLEAGFRLLPGAAAANGFLLFGMSAAFMLGVFSRLRMDRR